jgi:hypothetical protein
MKAMSTQAEKMEEKMEREKREKKGEREK